MENEIKMLKKLLIVVLVVKVIATLFVIDMKLDLEKADLGHWAKMGKAYEQQLQTWQKDTEAWKKSMEAWEKGQQRRR